MTHRLNALNSRRIPNLVRVQFGQRFIAFRSYDLTLGKHILSEAARENFYTPNGDAFAGRSFLLAVSNFEGLNTLDAVARRVRTSLAATFYIDRTKVPDSGRIGVAIYPEHGSTG